MLSVLTGLACSKWSPIGKKKVFVGSWTLVNHSVLQEYQTLNFSPFVCWKPDTRQAEGGHQGPEEGEGEQLTGTPVEGEGEQLTGTPVEGEGEQPPGEPVEGGGEQGKYPKVELDLCYLLNIILQIPWELHLHLLCFPFWCPHNLIISLFIFGNKWWF